MNNRNQQPAGLQKADDKKPDEAQLPANRTTGSALAQADFGGNAGAGLENMSADEIKIPFLNLLQPLSPQVKPVTAGGMPGAKPGMLLNGATGELFDPGETPLMFVPVFRTHQYLEFTPRALGGGFVAMYTPNDAKVLKLREAQGKFGKLFTDYPPKRNDKGEVTSGTEVMETFSLYGLFQDPTYEQWFKAILSFKSTQIPKYQSMMGRLLNFKYANPNSTDANPLPPDIAPIYGHRWSVKTVFEKNKSGEFYGYQLSLAEKNADGTEKPYSASMNRFGTQLFAEAEAFYVMLKAGQAKADYGTENKAGDEETGRKPTGADTPPM